MKLPAIGMRTIKSGIGAFLCAVLGRIGIIDNPFFAVGACVVSMQNTIKDSFDAGFNRSKGTLVGGFFGFIFVLFFNKNIFMCSIGLMIAIYVCNLLNLKASVQICGITYASIAFTIVEQNPLAYSIHRTLDTTLGVLVGVFVNYIISRPDLLENIFNDIKELKTLSLEMVTSNIKLEDFQLKQYENKFNSVVLLITKYCDDYARSKKELSIHDLELIIFKFKEIKIHLFCLQKLDKCSFSNENILFLNNLFPNEIIDEVAATLDNDEKSTTIYNYHLNEILKCISEINDWIKKVDF